MCGRHFGTDNNGNGMAGENEIIGRCYEAYNEHLSTCTGADKYLCGKENGQTWPTKDVTTLGGGDSIVSISFN